MDTGMLWLDDRGRLELSERVRQAAASYRAQYGMAPNLCLVSSAVLDELGYVSGQELGGLRLEASSSLLPHYLWIGQAEEVAA